MSESHALKISLLARGARVDDASADGMQEPGPPRIVLGHLQNQRLDLGIEAWPTRATPAPEGCPLSPHQLAMPTENRLRPDKHAD